MKKLPAKVPVEEVAMRTCDWCELGLPFDGESIGLHVFGPVCGHYCLLPCDAIPGSPLTLDEATADEEARKLVVGMHQGSGLADGEVEALQAYRTRGG